MTVDEAIGIYDMLTDRERKAAYHIQVTMEDAIPGQDFNRHVMYDRDLHNAIASKMDIETFLSLGNQK